MCLHVCHCSLHNAQVWYIQCVKGRTQFLHIYIYIYIYLYLYLCYIYGGVGERYITRVFDTTTDNTRETFKAYTKNGVSKVDGGTDLKDSQQYPIGYGIAIHKIWRRHRKRLKVQAKESPFILRRGCAKHLLPSMEARRAHYAGPIRVHGVFARSKNKKGNT